MNAKIRRIAALLFVISALAVYASGYFANPEQPAFDINSIKSYRDLPGITDEEISAI